MVGLLGTAGNHPDLPSLPRSLPEGFQTLEGGGTAWRLFVHTLPSGARLAAGQMTAVRNEVARASGLRTLIPILLLVPVLALLAAWLIRRGLQPVRSSRSSWISGTTPTWRRSRPAGCPPKFSPSSNRSMA